MRPSFEQYVQARGPDLLRFAYVLCGDYHLAQDLVQEVLAKVYRRWSRIEADNPDPYVRKSIVRTHLSWRMRRANRPHGATADAGSVSITVGDTAFPLAWDYAQEVSTSVGGLPARQRVSRTADNPWVMLSWAQDGWWITIVGEGQLTGAQLKQVGEGLRLGRQEIRTPIRLALAPRGWVIGSLGGSIESASRTSLRGAAEAAFGGRSETASPLFICCLTHPETAKDMYSYLCINVTKHRLGNNARQEGTKVRVNHRDGWLVPGTESGPTLYFDTADWAVSVSHGLGPRLSDADLTRFAEGISIVER